VVKVIVQMGVEVDGFSVHLVESVESGNPLFHAKETERMIHNLKVKIREMVASNFGDITVRKTK